MNTPHGFCPCVSKTEFKFVTDKFDKIVKQREKENEKDLRKMFEADLDVIREHNYTIPEPVPNGNHTYCQVCNENYDDYLFHIKKNETHQIRAKIQEAPFSEIDQLFAELNIERKWVNRWPSDPVEETKIEPDRRLATLFSFAAEPVRKVEPMPSLAEPIADCNKPNST